MKPAALLRSDVVRFGIVSVLGLGLDLSLAWSLATFGGTPLPVAAVAGFLAGAALNYVLHARWTFGSGDRRLTAGLGGRYLLGLGATLLTRVATVAVLERVAPPGAGADLLVLIGGTGLSFLVNYLLSKHLVFRPERSADALPPSEPRPHD